MEITKKDIIYPKECYKIIGILFDVYNELGSNYQEKYYQRAITIAFKKAGLKFKQQVFIPLKYKDSKIGNYFLDFLIEDIIVLEIKKGDYFSRLNIQQVLAYLKASNLKLGILANFTTSGIKFKRIVNIN